MHQNHPAWWKISSTVSPTVLVLEFDRQGEGQSFHSMYPKAQVIQSKDKPQAAAGYIIPLPHKPLFPPQTGRKNQVGPQHPWCSIMVSLEAASDASKSQQMWLRHSGLLRGHRQDGDPICGVLAERWISSNRFSICFFLEGCKLIQLRQTHLHPAFLLHKHWSFSCANI